MHTHTHMHARTHAHTHTHTRKKADKLYSRDDLKGKTLEGEKSF